MKTRALAVTAAVAILASIGPVLAGSTVLKDADRGLIYQVRITNLMKLQQLTPAVVATSSNDLQPIFELGQPIRADMQPLVEDADTNPIVNTLSHDSKVKDVQVIASLILPGQSASVNVSFSEQKSRVTVASMLATTNDGFIALAAVPGPRSGEGSVTYFVPVYDAGSETNDERCQFIPGPFCKNFFVHDPAPGEGFVHIHEGIRGSGELASSAWDWKNPGARITITRVGESHDDDN
jgi:hypothetical protein